MGATGWLVQPRVPRGDLIPKELLRIGINASARMGRGDSSPLRRTAQSRGPRDYPSPRRSHGVLAEAEDFHVPLCPKNRGMEVGARRRIDGQATASRA